MRKSVFYMDILIFMSNVNCKLSEMDFIGT